MNDPYAVVIDDDPQIRSVVKINLERRGWQAREVANGTAALQILPERVPDLVILDLVMPGGPDGVEVCRAIRERWDMPIIVLSARSEEAQKVLALDAGADDFVTKPFGQDELMARVRAVMRRAGAYEPVPAPRNDTIQIGGLTIQISARRAFVDNSEVRLTRTEFALLVELANHADSVLTHDELLARVWGEEYRGASHYLHVYFGRIRKKMGDAYSGLLESVPGVGYVLHDTTEH